MKNKTTRNLKLFSILPFLLMLLGILLLIYMISFEDESGALPLFLIIAGTAWLIINRIKIKRSSLKTKS
jgi:hypothetical protein